MKKYVVFAMICLSGCTTINFENGTASNEAFETEKWHHNVALGLVEVSDPVNLEEECSNKDWERVQTELSFINGLASGVVNVFAPIWYPKTVSVSCK